MIQTSIGRSRIPSLAAEVDSSNLLGGLQALTAELEQQRNSIQVLGRALTPEEIQKVQEIDAALPFLEGAIGALQTLAGTDPGTGEDGGTIPEPIALIDGRYRGGNADLEIELRLDEAGSGVISADIFHKVIGGTAAAVASLRTAPGLTIALSENAWPIIAQDIDGTLVEGELEIVAAGTEPLQIQARVQLDTPLVGIAAGLDVLFAASYESPSLRRLGLEIDTEDGQDPPPEFQIGDRTISVPACLEETGFEVQPAGVPTTILGGGTPWSTSELHGLMEQVAQSALSQPDWSVRLLWLAQATNPRLLGIMFDTTTLLPRQGVAIFAETVKSFAGSLQDEEAVMTTVHEVGHALNLAHRFEREVGRRDSLSFMNYPQRYTSGEYSFWNQFDWRFDPDELAFLRHGPRPEVIPGGEPFHSVRYWAEGDGGYVPYVPEQPLTILDLELLAPAGGTFFQYGQPVFLEVKLTNKSGETLNLSEDLIDVKSDTLEILVRRTGDAGGGTGREARRFRPVMHRCFRHGAIDRAVPDGDWISNNIQLTFGSAGFTFAEPGRYEIEAVFVLWDGQNQVEYVTRSAPLSIHVGAPASAEDARIAEEMFQRETGLYLALGGASAGSLDGTHDRLQGLVERLLKKKGKVHPIAASLLRCQGLRALQRALQRDEEDPRRVLVVSEPCEETALEALQRIDNLTGFDDRTAAQTKSLIQRLAKAGERGV